MMSEAGNPSAPTPLDAVRERPGGRSAMIRKRVLASTREELLREGYGGLSHRTVAKRANVDPATVYRRWPTRSVLAVDALLEVASASVPVPNTGAVAKDMEGFLNTLVVALSDPGMLRMFHVLSAASAEAEPGLHETIREFWHARFALARQMITRAVERGDLPQQTDPDQIIEHLVSPAYFRALVTGEAFDPKFARRCVSLTLNAARATAAD